MDAGGDEVDDPVDPRREDEEPLFLKPKIDLLFDFSGCRLARSCDDTEGDILEEAIDVVDDETLRVNGG
jgi:hypothetical protein